MELSKRCIFLSALLLRAFLLSLPFAFEIVSYRPELTSKLTSVHQLKEAVFLWRQSVNLYDVSCMPAPCLVAFASWLPDSLYGLCYVLLDLLIGLGWSLFADSLNATQGVRVSTRAVLLCYLLNPMTWLSTLAQSSSLWNHVGIVFGLLLAQRGFHFYSVGFILFSAHLSVYPIMFLIPVYMLSSKRIGLASFLVHVVVWLSFFTSLSYWLMGSFDFVRSTCGCIFCLDDLTPNIGLFWYLFIEMFQDFRALFLSVFHSTTFFLALPLAIKFRADPIFLTFIYLSMQALLKSYPTLADLSLSISFVPFVSYLLPRTRRLVISITAFLYGVLLAPIFHYLWIYQGSGNANFYYAMTILMAIAQVVFILDFVQAKLEFDLIELNPRLKEKPHEWALGQQ